MSSPEQRANSLLEDNPTWNGLSKTRLADLLIKRHKVFKNKTEFDAWFDSRQELPAHLEQVPRKKNKDN